MKNLSVPAAHAAVRLGQHRPADAIKAMEPYRPFEMEAFDAPTLLGRAYLEAGDARAAELEYRKILDHRGVDGISELYPQAYLGLARALRAQGHLSESRASYEQLFEVWKKADADLPPLVDARREYAELH